MKKGFRYYYLKFLTVVLLTIGMLVGFTTKIIAQYGAPVVDFFMKGKIRSSVTNNPIPNIQMTQHGRTSTDENGEFGFYILKDWGAVPVIYIEDIDGDLNGKFQDKIIFIEEKNRDDTVEFNIFLEPEKSIDMIVEENNFPTTFNNKEIIYKEILYLADQNWVEIRPKKTRYYGSVYLNGKTITQQQRFNDVMSFELDSFNEVNYFFVDINSNSDNSEIIQFSYNFESIELKQTKNSIEAVIIYARKPEKF